MRRVPDFPVDRRFFSGALPLSPARRFSRIAKKSFLARNEGGYGAGRRTAPCCGTAFSVRNFLPHGGNERRGFLFFSLRLGHAAALTVPRTVIHSRRAAALPPPRLPSVDWFDRVQRENGGSGAKKSNPFSEIRNFPALLHWLAGFGVKGGSVLNYLKPPLCKGRCRPNGRRRDCLSRCGSAESV